MRLIRNAVGISNLVLILLLLIAAIFGAVLSYMWTMGYYLSLELQLPQDPSVTISNVVFDPQDSTFFNLTLLNPSFSPFSVRTTQVMVSAEDGSLENVAVLPALPQELATGESRTLKCLWNWANHTDEDVKVHVFVAEGSGATFQTKTPLVELAITEAVFNSTISVTHFNVTVQNSASSVTYVNITGVTVDTETVQNVTPSLPYTLQPNVSISFMCSLNWTDYQGKEVAVKVDTLQGYTAYHTLVTSEPVVLTITDVLFDTSNTTRFIVTVQNNVSSPTYVNVTGIAVNVTGIAQEITELNVTLPYVLHPSSVVTFECLWDWAGYQGMTVEITVHTEQGFEISYVHTIPGG